MTRERKWLSAANWTNQWLRSPGDTAARAARVDGNGTVVGNNAATNAFGVRQTYPHNPSM